MGTEEEWRKGTTEVKETEAEAQAEEEARGYGSKGE